METLAQDLEQHASDPGRWCTSLANNAEFLLGALNAAGVKSVAEVGAYAGDLTGLLLSWAETERATVIAIDPLPQQALIELDESRDDLNLVRANSHEALEEIPIPDAVVLDGDHNYFTVAGELRIIAERVGEGPLPLLLFHDVGWPHGRRDLYEAPDAIPEEHRLPMRRGAGLFPGVEGVHPGGLPMIASAETEGGPRNGVLTAIEDFIEGRPDLRLVIIPSFFGLGILWSRSTSYDEALAELLDPWDRSPILARLEANRVHHLATSHVRMIDAAACRERDLRKTELLKKLLISKSFAVGQAISRFRQRGEPAFSKSEVEALVAETETAQ